MKISVTQRLPKASTPLCLLLGKLKKIAVLFLMAIFIISPAMAQSNIEVKGRITNDKNQPVASATVAVKGTSRGTTTNENGDFQISAPSNGTLVVSSVGYPTKEISVSGLATHNVTLTTSTTDMEQVIVVGYGTAKKGDVTGSVGSVSGN